MQIEGEEGSVLGWAEERVLPGWNPRPGPTPSRPSSSAPLPPLPPTACPRPEPRGPQLSPRIPGRSAVEAAARD